MRSKGYIVAESCAYFGKSRQGYYERIQFDSRRSAFNKMVLGRVNEIRELLPKCGTRKLHYLLKEEDIKIGRDSLFTLLRANKLLIKRKRRYVKTTDSEHSLNSYDNLLKELEITEAEEVFVSDITYIRTAEGFCYLAIVADAYTKKIMGKFISRDMQTTLVLKALVEALRNKQYNRSLIHHSDHGSQYSAGVYTGALRLNNIMISMAGKGKAWENPVAERVMGILKQEFGLNQTFKTFDEANENIELAIHKYNTIRPHLSCGYLTPNQAHDKGKNLVNVWQRNLSTYPQKEERKKEAKKERRKITTTTTVKFI
jgi:transposase InsO family protein